MKETIDIRKYEQDIERIYRALNISSETGEIENITLSILRTIQMNLRNMPLTTLLCHSEICLTSTRITNIWNMTS